MHFGVCFSKIFVNIYIIFGATRRSLCDTESVCSGVCSGVCSKETVPWCVRRRRFSLMFSGVCSHEKTFSDVCSPKTALWFVQRGDWRVFSEDRSVYAVWQTLGDVPEIAGNQRDPLRWRHSGERSSN